MFRCWSKQFITHLNRGDGEGEGRQLEVMGKTSHFLVIKVVFCGYSILSSGEKLCFGNEKTFLGQKWYFGGENVLIWGEKWDFGVKMSYFGKKSGILWEMSYSGGESGILGRKWHLFWRKVILWGEII